MTQFGSALRFVSFVICADRFIRSAEARSVERAEDMLCVGPVRIKLGTLHLILSVFGSQMLAVPWREREKKRKERKKKRKEPKEEGEERRVQAAKL